MKHTLTMLVLICSLLVWTAPVLAGGDLTITQPSDAARQTYPLMPGRTLTMKLKAGTANGTFEYKFTPTKEAVGGSFKRITTVNVTLDNCAPSYPFNDTGTFAVKCTLELKDASADGWTVYRNESKGDLLLHIN